MFNRNKLRLLTEKTWENIAESEFYHYTHNDLLDRLKLLQQDFAKILVLGSRYANFTSMVQKQYPHSEIFTTFITQKLSSQMRGANYLVIDEEKLTIDTKFDLIIYGLGLQWINNIPLFLQKIFAALTPNGMFITNFIGGSSLNNLRTYLTALETKAYNAHSAHIIPFIHFDDIVKLLQHAKFGEVITDFENIGLEFKSPLQLIRQIQNIGATNILTKAANYAISKEMYLLLKQDAKIFNDKVTLITALTSKNKHNISTII